MLLNLEGFTYAYDLNLNMGYYRIEVSPGAKKLCTIALPWGNYKNQKLPMGFCTSTDIFQEKVFKIFEGFDMVRVYIYVVLETNKNDLKNRLNALDKVLLILV